MNWRTCVLVVVAVGVVGFVPVEVQAEGLSAHPIDLLGAPSAATQYQGHGGTSYSAVPYRPVEVAAPEGFFAADPGPVPCTVVALNADGTFAFAVPAVAERAGSDGMPARVRTTTGSAAANEDLRRFEGRILVAVRPGQANAILTAPLMLVGLGGPAGVPVLALITPDLAPPATAR